MFSVYVLPLLKENNFCPGSEEKKKSKSNFLEGSST